MSMENVKKFLELVKTDEGLARKVVELKDSLQGSAGAGNENEILAEKVLPLAKAHGLEFTVEEFLAYANSVSGELSDDDLLNVSGGISARGVALGLLFATGLSFVPTIVSSFATGGGSPMPSAPGTAISQSYDIELEENSSIELEERKSEKEVRSSREDVRRASGQVRAAQKRVDVLESKLKKDAKVDNVDNVDKVDNVDNVDIVDKLTKKQKKKFSKLINQIKLAKEDLSAAKQKLEASQKQTNTAKKVKTDVKEKNASIIKERLERKDTENNRKQFADVMKELLESKRDQNDAVVGQVDNKLEEKHEERQDEIKEQVENKEDESKKDGEVIIEEKEEVVEEKKEEKKEEVVEEKKKDEEKVETREEAVERIRGEIEATIEKYKDRLSDEEKEKLEDLKDGIGNQTWYATTGDVQTAWNLELNKLKHKYDTNNVDANVDYDTAADDIGGFFDTDVNNEKEKKDVVEEKKEEVAGEKKEEVIEEDEENVEEAVDEEKKEEVVEEEDVMNEEKNEEEVKEAQEGEKKENEQQKANSEKMKTELVKLMKDNSTVYMDEGIVKGLNGDVYAVMKKAGILDLNEAEQKKTLTEAIKEVLPKAADDKVIDFVNTTFIEFSRIASTGVLRSENIVNRTETVKRTPLRTKILKLKDTYASMLGEESENAAKLDRLFTKLNPNDADLNSIEKELEEFEENLKEEAAQYNAKLKELKKRAVDIDNSLYVLDMDGDKNYDTLDTKYQVIKSALEQEKPDLKQIENDINELEKLIEKSNEKELSQVKFDGETGSWEGTIANLYKCLKDADFDIHRIENLDDWQESCEKALKAMTVKGDTLEIPKAWWFGTPYGAEKTDYEHKAMLKTLALFAMELDKKIDKGTAKTFADEVTTVKNGKINVKASETQVKISEIKGNDITLKEFVEGKK